MNLPSIPGYQSLELLGKSAFGYSIKAIDSKDQKVYAFKLFTPRSFAHPQEFETAKAALKAEALRLIALDHPQIARYRTYFKITPGQHPQRILVQTWINGSSYQSHLQRPFAEIQVHQFLKDILPVLDYLHTRKITHGDICPDNLIFCAETAKPVLINFGGPKRALAKTATTPQIKALGQHPGYSPSEQENGQAEPASDIYALGVTLLVLLSGQTNDFSVTQLTQPTSPQLNSDWFNKTAAQPHPWQQALEISPSFRDLLTMMLQPNPQERPSASELLTLCKTLQAPLPRWEKPKTPYGAIADNQPLALTEPSNAPSTIPINQIPINQIPNSQAATIAIGRKAIETHSSSSDSRNHQDIWPIWVRPLKASEPLLKFILLYLLFPTVAILGTLGLGRQALSRWQTQLTGVALPRISTPVSQPPISAANNSEEKTGDCRDTILVRGETLQIESWQPVDEKFQATYPEVSTIDPLNPEHRPYVQAWCDLAEDWLDQRQ